MDESSKDLELSHIEGTPSRTLSLTHERYLLERHGTTNLDPIPSMSPDDPLNWPQWKKNTQIFLVVVHAFMATFSAAAVMPAFAKFSEIYDVSMEEASYLVSVQILFLGLFPLFWNPIAERYGRRPVYLVPTLMMCVMNIAGGFCKSYGEQMATRVLFCIFCCPPLGFGSAVVTELFFAHERGQKMGWWTLMITIGIPTGALIFGYVVEYTDIHWLFWILACAHFVEFLGYLALNAETRYDRDEESDSESPSKCRHPSIMDFVRPLAFFGHYRVLVPAVAYGFIFTYASVTIGVEIPGLFGAKFHFDSGQVGLQYIAVLIGATLGEQISGPVSDLFLKKYTKRTGRHIPEHRIWISYIGFATAIVGIMVWAVQFHNAEEGHWNVTPLVGAAIANFGCQIVITTQVTYAVDCYQEYSGQIGVFINVVRQTWAFLGPFYFTDAYENLGFIGGNGLFAGLVFAIGFIPAAAVHIRGVRAHS